MKVALVTSIVPFIHGGARNIVEWLSATLRAHGHETEIIAIPFDESQEILLAQMAAFRMIDLTDRADLVICFRPPSYLVRHPRKVLWFIHHIRPYYDLWDTEYRGFADTAVSRARRDVIRMADSRAFAEASAIFTNSRLVSDRLHKFNGIRSEVLYPPLFESEAFGSAGYGDEILALARLEHHKRQHLLVEALSMTETAVRLRLLGMGSSPLYPARLRAQAAELGVEDRLTIDDRWIDEPNKREALAGALACAYLPFDEDSYGYPSLEAAYSSKAILTTTDSGGVLEFVQDGLSGLVVEPDARQLALAMDRLHAESGLAQTLGAGSRERIDQLQISWDHVVEKILA